MRTRKIFILAVLSLSLFTTCTEAQNKVENPKKTDDLAEKADISNKPSATKDDSSVKVLAAGSSSKVKEPFIFVARSKETYAALKNFVDDLPADSQIDFTKSAVVAAFAGLHNTGGYSVIISKAADKFVLDLLRPPTDSIVTMALTHPFKVALVPLEEENTLSLTLSSTWKNAMQNYKLSSGTFEYSGGFAGRRKQFAVEGAIRVLTYGDLITLDFNLSGKGADKNMKLDELASGTIKEGKVEITRVDVGSFSEGPRPPDKVYGTLTGDTLSLVFEPLPTLIRDGFAARGSIEAAKTK